MVAAIAAAAVLIAVALAHLDAAAAAYVDLQLEQSFGAEFLSAGTLKGDLDGRVCWPDLGHNAQEMHMFINRNWSYGDARAAPPLCRASAASSCSARPGQRTIRRSLCSWRAMTASTACACNRAAAAAPVMCWHRCGRAA